jgi:hypothetical protein
MNSIKIQIPKNLFDFLFFGNSLKFILVTLLSIFVSLGSFAGGGGGGCTTPASPTILPPESICSGGFYDSGGSGGNYGNCEHWQKTLTSSTPGKQISVLLTDFNTESGYDFLYVYDGTSSSDPLIATLSGGYNSSRFTSTNGSLTFRFRSDGSTTGSGWVTSVSCVSCVPHVNAGSDVTICGGSVNLNALVTTEMFPPNSTLINATQNDIGINRVVFSTIDHSTTDNFNSYKDYTTVQAQVNAGESYGLSVWVNTVGNNTVRTFAWIDWNRDGDFDDAGEFLGNLGNVTNNSNGLTPNSPMSVTIPAWADGLYRLRVRTRFNADPTTYTANDYSEAEDYTVYVPNFIWSPATGLSAANVFNPIASPATTQTYTATVANGPGCSASSQVTVTVTPLSITGNTTLCAIGTTSDLNIVGDVNWTGLPTGGTVTTVGNDRIHTFTGNGNFTSAHQITNASVLLVGGGGSGGSIDGGATVGAGGGGGGGVISTVTSISALTHPVVIGNGGVGVSPGSNNGGNTTFFGLTAVGGGAGGHQGSVATSTGKNGGSGGGGRNAENGGTGVALQGNNGGRSTSAAGSANRGAGGGGGATGVGGNTNTSTGGTAGPGFTSTISGGSLTYAAGGVGGAGGQATSSIGTDASSNTGNGGSGATASTNSLARRGGNGGSGILIIRYSVPNWTSSNPAVATVNPITGVVTAVSVGTSTISYSNSIGCTASTLVTVDEGSLPPTSVSGGGTFCDGNAVTLTSIGGTNTADIINTWYEDGCNNAFTQVWNNQPYAAGSTTVNSTTNGILNLTSTTNDPMIFMSGLGSYNPAVYRYVNIRYRVLSGTAGSTEIFFYNTAHDYAVGGETGFGAMISDGQWHVVSIDMHLDPDYLTGGNITGWRYDWATASGVTMELDFIQLSQYRMIDENGTDNTLTVSPGSPYYPTAGQTKTFATAKIDNCGVTTCQQGSITLGPQTLVLATNGEQKTCIVNANETVHFYAPGTGNYITTVQAGATSLGNVTATVYDDGAPQLVNACGNPSPSSATHVMERHWVITPTTNGPANVYLPYFTAERTALMTAANANANSDDDVANQGAIKLSKYSGGAWPASLNVDADPNNNCPPPHSTGAGGTELINNNGFGTVQAYIPTFPIITEYSRYPITGFSEFWLHGQIDSPLPVSMKSFSASCSDDIHVTWTTASEQNTSHFVLQRSRDLNQWEDVKVVNSMGTTSYSTDYHVVDNTSLQKAYYRLKQVDLDGNTEFIGPISIDCDKKNNSMIVYPNPTNAGFTVEINAQDNIKEAALVIYDITGKLVQYKELNNVFGSHLITFDKGSMEAGSYMIVLEGKDKNKFTPIKLILN